MLQTRREFGHIIDPNTFLGIVIHNINNLMVQIQMLVSLSVGIGIEHGDCTVLFEYACIQCDNRTQGVDVLNTTQTAQQTMEQL